MASQITNITIVTQLFIQAQIKKTTKLFVTGFVRGIPHMRLRDKFCRENVKTNLHFYHFSALSWYI